MRWFIKTLCGLLWIHAIYDDVGILFDLCTILVSIIPFLFGLFEVWGGSIDGDCRC